MFNQNQSPDIKIAVLEERLSAYELMLKRIDEAIQLMGKTNQNISKMLAVHEERIEQCGKADDYITRMIEELRMENKDQHETVFERIDSIEEKLEEVIKFRWMVIGAAIVISFIIAHTSTIIDVLTSGSEPVRIERLK